MQPYDGPQLEHLSAQVALVRAKTRPWRSIIAIVLAIAAAATSGWAHGYFDHYFTHDGGIYQLVAAATALAFCFFASAATIGLSGKARSVLEPVMGVGHAAVVRYALVLIGAVTILLVTLALFSVPIGQLLLGGALTSVFVGIAAQQALSNVFAGLVLLLARPFQVGDAIRLRAGALSGEIDGTVTEIGITYVRLSTDAGLMSVPNSQVLNAAVGPQPASGWPPPITPVPPATVQAATVQAATAEPAPAQPGTARAPGNAAGAAGDPGTADGSAAAPVGTADGAGGAHRPGTGGEQ
jgi:small-conductance mechanosensitive channel